MELTYTMQGDYLLPNLTAPENPRIGKYGMLRRKYLQNYKQGLYSGMMLSGKLNSHLEEIDRQAENMMATLTAKMTKAEGLTEELKARNQMEWVQRMNSIRHAAEETVNAELIYS